ncbi:hypothetical protein THICB1_20011 [Thiomonas arsenitoxydans]|uniref:Transposase n=1 Tax=Thiomonas arsenitoxydans (strain DSM 22701 / CIP 110005 / 3As) TaxID=426114 RepID=A0ABM9T4J7_THIA3|nr:hypothetical protein THICB6_120171 [Thiomonas arsenitoxydans]CQR31886.1 hypothetical protein THICB1_20011 [Thiomonas arsenitoxydans]CQR34869.1 hypothetical protein ACO7_420009 [Thiomonas arsenitoxydans]CQR34929.1 hypothetical protein ACO3_420016 [Thiomonas arsenitoxydans]CQR44517.1 hypothetical protein THICB3520014 [Thiomonas sp. CB3]
MAGMVEAIDDDKLRALGDDPAALYARRLIEELSGEAKRQALKNAALSLEVARLKRWRFGQSSESLDSQQGELFDAKTQALLQQEEQAEDRAADDERGSPNKRRPKRQPLPGNLERIEHHYEIDSGLCPQGHVLKRIGEEISEQLDCEPAHETPVAELKPGAGKTHRAYVWVYRSACQPLVVYDYRGSRAGEHARKFLRGWSGTLVVDDFSGYKALFAGGAIREAGCWAHARRKFFEAHKLTGSALAAQALERIGELYRIEQDIRDLDPVARLRRRRQDTQPRLHALHAWLSEQRPKLAKADATARAIDYALGRWTALGVFADDHLVPIDNNAAERAVRPIALGRNKANFAFMRSQHDAVVSAPWAGSPQGADGDSHNHSPCRNANRAFGARYRACLISGCFSRASARSFMAKSASTYM